MKITDLHFNEDELLQMLVAAERYNDIGYDGKMEQENPKMFEALKHFNRIWYDLELDEEYFIAEKPF